MKQEIRSLIEVALTELSADGTLPEIKFDNIQVDRTKDPSHGDFATNIALVLAKQAKMNPRALAELIQEKLSNSSIISKTEIAGPGFLNFFQSNASQTALIEDIINQGKDYGKLTLGQDQKIHIEYVSANPTGPLHVGHGRHAATGSAIASILSRVGFKVHKEYYVNDAGRQMDILAVSLWLRYLALFNVEFTYPKNGYRGQYILPIADKLKKAHQDTLVHDTAAIFADVPEDEKEDGSGDKEAHIDGLIKNAKALLKDNYATVHAFALNAILDDIKEDLSQFNVNYDEWFSEKSLFDDNQIENAVSKLIDNNYTFEKEGALWFKATEFGDEKDRVLIRANGTPTYFTSDCAYHVNKLTRGNDHIVDVMGADHHGYVPRLKGLLQAEGISEDKLDVVLVQFASLYRQGEKVQMSTRSGEFVTLRELREEVGNDAARFFYINRKADQHLDFDLDLAKSKTNENPVYYVQYAHARICSVFKQLAEKNLSLDTTLAKIGFEKLTNEHESALLKTLARYEEVLTQSANHYEPHRLTQYLRELAHGFHSYYNAHTFLIEDEVLRNARLSLVKATQIVLANSLDLLGISQPEAM